MAQTESTTLQKNIRAADPMTNWRLQRTHTKRQASQTLKKLTPHRRGPNSYPPESAKKLLQERSSKHIKGRRYRRMRTIRPRSTKSPKGNGPKPKYRKLESFRWTTKDAPNTIHKSAQHSTGTPADFLFVLENRNTPLGIRNKAATMRSHLPDGISDSAGHTSSISRLSMHTCQA
eukprot:5300233-Amphidinium_carterae.2